MPNYHSFDKVSTIPNKRTKLDSLSYEKKMTINEGDLRPVYFQEVLPGMMIHLRDAFSIKNIPTPLQSVIDDAYLDINYFFVPRRLLWKDWEPFIGADATPDAYTDPKSYVEPTIEIKRCDLNSVLNCFGIPYKAYSSGDGWKVNAAPMACFAFCWNEFYRDQNLQDENPVYATLFNKESGTNTSTDDSKYYWATVSTQVAFNSVNKYHDVFTSCLPKPQKSPDPVTLPLGVSAPVTAENPGQLFLANTGSNDIGPGYPYRTRYEVGGGETGPAQFLIPTATEGINATASMQILPDTLETMGAYADLTQATAASINDLRLAFAAQAYLEALARGGSRYTELLHQMFGVSPSDARLQRPEFLGTLHKRLSFTSVASTNGVPDSLSASVTNRPTGSLGGYSVTGGDQDVFFKQFEEHGYVIGLASIRVRHTYGQGIPKVFLKKDRFDYWSKYFDRIGEVPVDKKEIFAAGSGALGFQEAWYEYKFHHNEISGNISPDGATDLRAFTYADNYAAEPTLDSDFIRETRSNIDQTLIGASSIPQYVIDLYHQVTAVVPLSVTSVPAGIGF